MMSTKSNSKENYEELVERVKKINNVGYAGSILSWDQQTMMPPAGTPARSRQLSTLSSIQHELLTDEKTGRLLDNIDVEDISEEKRAVVREVRRRYERAVKVPTELVEKISKTASEAFTIWAESKEENKFSDFAPILSDMVEMKKEYANYIDPDSPPYEVLFQDFEPYLEFDEASKILKHLKGDLVPFIEKIKNSGADLDKEKLETDFSEEKQEEFVRKVLTLLGFDWERGRLDTSPHPFTAGTQYDVRITTKFEDNLLDSILSTIHEFGHATYTLGLPKDEYGTPLGEPRESTLHESQSRLWENHVGRSRHFWKLILTKLKEKFPSLDVSIEDVYEIVNQVHEDNVIRVEADELTYHMHVVLRFEMEKGMIQGDLQIEEIPEVWHDKMERYLGVRPETDSEGCLQDVHWSHGYFGYFPTYSLGSVLAAQIYDTVDGEIEGLDKEIENGDFEKLRNWLRENIHRYGKRYPTQEFIEKITDEKLDPTYFTSYIKNKLSKIYDL